MRTINENTQARGIVIGYSMGGLVARHALTKMEHNNQIHNIKSFISYDSPHKGAYIPPSLELYLRNFKDSLGKNLTPLALVNLGVGLTVDYAWRQVRQDSLSQISNALDIFDAPSVKQMLAFWIGKRADDGAKARLDEMYANPETKAAHPSYYAFRNDLIQLGNYPKKLRKVAISNGNINRNVWAGVARPEGVKIFDFRVYFDPIVGSNDTLFRSRLFDDPWSQSGTLFKQTFVGDTDSVSNVRLSGGKGNYGSSPGRYNMMMAILSHRMEKKGDINLGIGHMRFSTPVMANPGQARRTFVPTVSALDLPTQNLFYTPTNLAMSPFDQVYTSGTHENLEHAQINANIVQDLVQELLWSTSGNKLVNPFTKKVVASARAIAVY